MKNKIIFYAIALVFALILKPILNFIIEARDCKSELQNLKIIEENDLKIHTEKIEQLKNTLKNAKNKEKIDYNFNNDLDNDFLLEELK
jgi:phosphotransferase system  glucose/maltose/N-acetylglucosamine-specific IIC component